MCADVSTDFSIVKHVSKGKDKNLLLKRGDPLIQVRLDYFGLRDLGKVAALER